MSEWMKVMLEEIERKRQEAEQARIEQARREEEAAQRPRPADPADDSAQG
jgi:hypothetical protein